jgi:Synergist-CTERM protein sorting domain-containing protein
MLDGWTIVKVTPQSGKHWKAKISDGSLVVTFHGDVYDQAVTVTLEKGGVQKEIEITFSGEEDYFGGCNAGASMLALLALFPLFMRR